MFKTLLLFVFLFSSVVLTVTAFVLADPTTTTSTSLLTTTTTTTTTTTSAAPSFSIPSGLCSNIPSNTHTLFHDIIRGKTFFFSVALCEDAALTTAGINNKEVCGQGKFRVATKPGTTWTIGNDTSCQSNQFFNTSVVTNVTSQLVEIKMYEGEVTTEYTPLTLRINCVSKEDGNEDSVTREHPLNITHVQQRMQDTHVILVVEAYSKCIAYPSPPPDDTNRAGFYIAIAFTTLFVVAFSGVLFKAKLAGDRLRELKRLRGERQFLG